MCHRISLSSLLRPLTALPTLSNLGHLKRKGVVVGSDGKFKRYFGRFRTVQQRNDVTEGVSTSHADYNWRRSYCSEILEKMLREDFQVGDNLRYSNSGSDTYLLQIWSSWRSSSPSLALWNDNIYRGFLYCWAHVNWAVGAIGLVMLGGNPCVLWKRSFRYASNSDCNSSTAP